MTRSARKNVACLILCVATLSQEPSNSFESTRIVTILDNSVSIPHLNVGTSCQAFTPAHVSQSKWIRKYPGKEGLKLVAVHLSQLISGLKFVGLRMCLLVEQNMFSPLLIVHMTSLYPITQKNTRCSNVSWASMYIISQISSA